MITQELRFCCRAKLGARHNHIAFAHKPRLLAFPKAAAEHYIPHSSASAAAEHAPATTEGSSSTALLYGTLCNMLETNHYHIITRHKQITAHHKQITLKRLVGI